MKRKMKKIKKYRYLGLNGILTTFIQLNNVPCDTIYVLQADEGKLLTNGERIEKTVSIHEDNLVCWHEIEDPEANLNK